MKEYNISTYTSNNLLDDLCKRYHTYSFVSALYDNNKDVVALQSTKGDYLKNIFVIQVGNGTIGILNS